MKLLVIDGTGIANINGLPMVKYNLTNEQILELSNNPSEERVIEIFNPKFEEVAKQNREIEELIERYQGSDRIEFKDDSFFRKGIPYTLPPILLEKYKQFEDEGNEAALNALDNFWVKCALNPNPEVRQNLFWFLNKYGFTLTPSGNFIVYRSLNILQKGHEYDDQLVNFVKKKYGEKRGQKKAPKNYNVYFDDFSKQYELVKVENDDHSLRFEGNLQELWNTISTDTETIYTDAHTGSFRVRIGEPVKMDREACDHNQENTCSRGLHVAGASWLSSGSFGSVDVVCIVNPYNTIAIPPKDDYGKMRVCEYLPIALVERDDEGNIIPIDTSVFESLYDTTSVQNVNVDLSNIDPYNQLIYSFKIQELPMSVFTGVDKYTDILKEKTIVNLWDSEEE